MALPPVLVDVPDQPAAGSVVLDSRGRAWQRCPVDALWRRGDGTGDGLTWAQLIATIGEVEILHAAGMTW